MLDDDDAQFEFYQMQSVAPALILVHFFSEGPLKRRNSLNTHISRNYEVLNEKQ